MDMFNVLKASGKTELFSEEKLRASIRRVGIPQNLQDEVIAIIKSRIYEGISTLEIYKYIMEFLKDSTYPSSRTKYSLKQSIMDLGPTGYPFEDYISEILKMEGYQTRVRQILQGKCISHEIDIVAEKDGKKSMIECKFHNLPGTRSQIHVPLYTKARFDDIKEKNNLSDVWLISNTKVTPDSLNYALCSNMKVISWDYPEKGSFRDLIEKYKLYPITTFLGLSQNQKQLLAEQHIVLAKEVCKNPSVLDFLGLPKDKKDLILLECQIYNDKI
jgi:hypothetical protein